MKKRNSQWVRLTLTFGLLLTALPVVAAPLRIEPLVQPGQWPGFTRGPACDIKVVGSRAYVAAGGGGLMTLDVSNPANPVRLGGYETGGYAQSVAVSGNLAYMADGTNGLQIIDVSDPAKPVALSSFCTGGSWALGVAVSGGTAYVAHGDDGLQIIDVSNPCNPVRLGRYDNSLGEGG